MFTKHFLKMLLALIGMILLGLLGLLLVNEYEKGKTSGQNGSIFDSLDTRY